MGLFDFLKKKEFQEINDLKTQLEKYKGISDIEIEIENKKKEFEEDRSKKEEEFKSTIESQSLEINQLQERYIKLNDEYSSALDIYTKLRKEVSLFESKLDLIEFGIYEPVYDFEKSDDYRNEQYKIIGFQKAMISEDKAAICITNWTVGNSEAKGRDVVNRYKKLMLRAFNGECDALIAKVKWNNINQMKERMQKIFQAINKLGEGFSVYLNAEYFKLKEKELTLEYEYQAKKQQEKEAIRAVQEELREEEKARKEYEQAQREAEKEEINYQKALERARKEVELATGEKQIKLQLQVEKLERELLEAQAKKERALSMAQQTKRGHVYIISNIGSFGESVYKIGMTRRLEPTDRIKELGDASVPFQFDIHAMIYSDEARTLEYELHKAFTNRKVNMLNYRKEFFNVTLEEIERKISEMGFEAEFTKLPEAMEYRETLAILEKMNKKIETKTVDQLISEKFPSSLSAQKVS